MTTLLMNEAELSVELNRLIATALDTRKKLLAFSVHAGTRAVGCLARSSAAALARAVHELSDLVRRLGGRPPSEAQLKSTLPVPVVAQAQVLEACEHAVAEVACHYRDALEWNLPESAQEILMRHFASVIDNYERINRLRKRVHALWTRRLDLAGNDSRPPAGALDAAA